MERREFLKALCANTKMTMVDQRTRRVYYMTFDFLNNDDFFNTLKRIQGKSVTMLYEQGDVTNVPLKKKDDKRYWEYHEFNEYIVVDWVKKTISLSLGKEKVNITAFDGIQGWKFLGNIELLYKIKR